MKSKKLNKIMNLFRGPRRHILVACFQKSGSTYLCSILRALTGYRSVQLCHRFGNNEQDLDENRLIRKSPMDYVCQQHVKGTENNLELIRRYGLKTIVHVRAVDDVVYSLHDHFEREDHRTPTGYVHRSYFEMPPEDKLMYLIRIHLPWYFNFFVSWLEAAETMPLLWTSYESLFEDQVATISAIMAHCGMDCGRDRIEAAIVSVQGQQTRKNVGKSGRGRQLPGTHQEEIRKMAEAWKMDKTVWRRIGLQM